MTRVLGLLGVLGLAVTVRLALPGGSGGASAAMPLGFVLVASFLLGGLAPKAGLPAITGYLLVGMVFGPHLLPSLHARLGSLAVLDAQAVASLRTLDAMALGLIALTAGGELRLESVRRNFRVIAGVLLGQVGWVFAGCVALGWALRGNTALFAGLSDDAVLASVLLLGAMATANSPATTLAVIQEYDARGPVSETVLTVTVVKDVVVISLFSVVLSLAMLLVRPEAAWSGAFMAQLAWEIVGSAGVGLLLGWLVAIYLERWGHEMPLLILATAFIGVTLLPALHLSGLLALMAAGFFIENFSEHGDGLIKAIERHALPVYVVFFTITGAGLDLSALAATLPFALALAFGRMAFTAAGTAMGAYFTGAPMAMVGLGWSGFVAQAGVTLGFAILVEQRFPEIGTVVKTATLAIVAVNQLVGPVLFRVGLFLAGEISGGRAGGEDQGNSGKAP